MNTSWIGVPIKQMIGSRRTLMCDNCMESEVSPLRFESNGFGQKTVRPVSLFFFFSFISLKSHPSILKDAKLPTEKPKHTKKPGDADVLVVQRAVLSGARNVVVSCFCRSFPSLLLEKSYGYSNKSSRDAAISYSAWWFLFKSLTAVLLYCE